MFFNLSVIIKNVGIEESALHFFYTYIINWNTSYN